MTNDELNRYYFTYGAEGHPFRGGWTVVEARDRDAAVRVFELFHPPIRRFNAFFPRFCELLGPEFEQTRMFREGNLGARCQERIVLTRERYMDGNE